LGKDTSGRYPPDISEKLLRWFDEYGRHNLPWQVDKTPYRVWVSEIMLQQTQVQTVIPYYERFMQTFPSVEDLARASEEEVLALWSGLGYYARGRNLRKAAQVVQFELNGEFPVDLEGWMALPGVGRSTAGAILSIACGRRAPILDGNVKRVLSRLMAVEAWPGERETECRMWQWAERLTPIDRFADYTQAIMDLGATLCTRSRPDCANCPLQNLCRAYQQAQTGGDPVTFYPRPKPKKSPTLKPTKHSLVEVYRNEVGEVLLQKRPSKGIWGGLWSFPLIELEGSEQRVFAESLILDKILGGQKVVKSPLMGVADTIEEYTLDGLKKGKTGKEAMRLVAPFRHTFTHFHLWLYPIQYNASNFYGQSLQGEWFPMEEALKMGLPAPIRKIMELMK
jgi:A/G-specific adenine glycosylase